ncbi:Serine protease HTRA2, mitochondrial [Eufriesea mexicana]|uniref:Serine protease HTRA2, mitochondrial n=1 Tax=Eufriesea mexicana TaxID=516756 RepID=A0A310SJR9_9HYME|nr:PREDICTED: serine protease HTRA2, mitochondrial [Eufriesea mexicana]OAD59918.1 Serine protease HTRA2, mitochondrial [Eufriesea mexicana]
MAAPLTRISWSILKRNQFQYKQILTVSDVNRFTQYKCSYTEERKSRISNKTIRNTLLYAVFFSGFGYIWYRWKDDYQHCLNNSTNSMFAVYAKQASWNDSNNRNKYNFIADVVEKSAPAVVYIEIKNTRKYDFSTGKPLNISNGSGFIVESDGLILTNAHVVNARPNTIVKVRLYDGTTYTGVVEDIDMLNDLATVRIDKKNLPVMKLGSSANLRPGEFVVAIGSPLSLSNTITSGVISSVNRHSQELGLDKQMAYIQTDAAITFGNSGGPLVNLDAEAIGINAMKVTSGISFAIPIDYAKDFLKRAELRRKGKGMKHIPEKVKTQYIGVTMLTLTSDLFYELQKKLKGISHNVTHGVLIYKVNIGSPAHIGGLRAGDIVTHVNDEPVISSATIYKAIESTKTLRLVVIREMQVLHIRIEPEEI